MINSHAKEYLDYYLNLHQSPEYAVLLRGKWGCGKSWFIKNYLSSRQDKEFIYVSLFGKKNYKDIEDDFFAQLHPFLASKKVKLAGKILKGVLKTTINIDLNNDTKPEGNVSLSGTDINLPEYLTKLDDKVLVFDDLERSGISIPDVLGYINQFVEGYGLKVIIIGNEEEIIKTDEKEANLNNKAYLLIKEKVIGRSFEIKADLDEAIKTFVLELNPSEASKNLTVYSSLIKSIYLNAGYNNLRHLRQSIHDFDRFFSFLPPSILQKVDLIDLLVNIFFALSFEIKKGELKEEDIPKVFSLSHYEGHDNIKSIKEKYSVLELYNNPLDETLWLDFFKVGTINKDSVKESIENSSFYANENTPAWLKLWKYNTLDDDEFIRLSEVVYKELASFKIEDKYELVHVVAMLLTYSEWQFITYTKEEILLLGKKNVDNLKTKGLLKVTKHERFPAESSKGLGYHGSDLNEFKEFVSYAQKGLTQGEVEDYPSIAQELMNLMVSSTHEFIEKMSLTNSANNLYYDIPILKYILPLDFVTNFLKLPNSIKPSIIIMLGRRYDDSFFRKELMDEKEWLEEVQVELENQSAAYNGKLSKGRIENLIGVVQAGIKKIEAETELMQL